MFIEFAEKKFSVLCFIKNLPVQISSMLCFSGPFFIANSISDGDADLTWYMRHAGVIPEAEVSITVDKGVNTSTRDLVLAAISVMKGRKARPDTKRLCNWVNRKYGRAVQDVVSEIDELCTEGILEKVNRIVYGITTWFIILTQRPNP